SSRSRGALSFQPKGDGEPASRGALQRSEPSARVHSAGGGKTLVFIRRGRRLRFPRGGLRRIGKAGSTSGGDGARESGGGQGSGEGTFSQPGGIAPLFPDRAGSETSPRGSGASYRDGFVRRTFYRE